MTSRSRSNPLALAVLCCLYERPMHPYEMSQTLRARAVHESIRLNFGTLYGVVASLEKRQLVRAVETLREGKRPPRTVYDITEAGRTELNEWLTELVSVPVKEYLQFEAGLALLSALPPDEVLPLLRQRAETLEFRLDQERAVLDAMGKRSIPRLYGLEGEYQVALLEADLAFTSALVADIEAGTLSGVDQWRSWHDGTANGNGGGNAGPGGAGGDDEIDDDNDDENDGTDTTGEL